MPRETIVMAVTCALMLETQPKWAAMSPMTAVKIPMNTIETKKEGHPRHFPGGTRSKQVLLFLHMVG